MSENLKPVIAWWEKRMSENMIALGDVYTPIHSPSVEWTVIEIQKHYIVCRSRHGTRGSWSFDSFHRKMVRKS
jgi:hypothetical protein